jgi:hypothetical protein
MENAMMKPIASRSLLALLSMLIVSTALAQERSHPRVANLSSVLSDYSDPTPEWPWYDPNRFGDAVAISNETAAVGMPLINDARGRVAIFQRTKSGWQRTGTLVASDAAPEQRFGHALAFRDNTIVVGASRAVYVFRLVNGAWRQTEKLTIPSSHTGINFPSSLAYQNGLLVAGAPSIDGTTSAIYFFQLSAAGKLVQRTRLLSPAGPASDQYSNDLFGSSVAMTSTHLLIGAPRDSADARGAAYLYTRTSTGWNLRQKLSANDAQPSAVFGSAVAINNGIIAIGAPNAEMGDYGEGNGAVYLFALAPGLITQYQKIVPPLGQPYDYGYDTDTSKLFGREIAMSQDRLVVAADEYAFGTFNPRGAVFAYRLSAGQAQLTGVSADFISTTSISLANNWLLVGIPLEDESYGTETFGTAAIFNIGSALCTGPADNGFWSDFDSSAEGWTPVTGNWSITNGSYVNSTSGASVVSMADEALPSCYTVNARMFLSWTGGIANSGGYLYDYKDQNNYRELTLARSASNRQLFTLSEIREGTRRVVSSTETGAWRPGEWVYLTLDRNQNLTRVRVDDVLQLEVTQAPVTVQTRVGLLARWNVVYFDGVYINIWE